MKDKRMHVLDRLNAGEISAEEAEKLLAEEGNTAAAASPAPDIDIPESRQLWLFPFVIGLAISGLSGRGMATNRNLVASIMLLPFFLLGTLLAFLGIASRSSHWIHVRVKEKNGTNIRISLPFPIEFAGWILDRLEPIIQEHSSDTSFKSLNIAQMIREMGDELSPENPIVVAVDDDDDDVLVYIT